MQKAQGRPRHDKDRLESSGRQKKEWKDLQVQLKRAGGGEMETAESAPVRHYYRKLPGGGAGEGERRRESETLI